MYIYREREKQICIAAARLPQGRALAGWLEAAARGRALRPPLCYAMLYYSIIRYIVV